MEIEKFLEENESLLKKLSGHYSRMFKVDYFDLLNEGSVVLLEIFEKYGKKRKTELLKLTKTILNRNLYKYCINYTKDPVFTVYSNQDGFYFKNLICDNSEERYENDK